MKRVNIPAIFAFVLMLSLLGVFFEVMVAGVRGEPVDGVAAGGFFTLAGTSLSALGAFWVRDSSQRDDDRNDPPSPNYAPSRHRPPENFEDSSDQEPPDRPGWLEAGVGRWRLC